jgi:hypothetical protein
LFHVCSKKVQTDRNADFSSVTDTYFKSFSISIAMVVFL